MYAAAIDLRKQQPNVERPYKAPALYLLAIVGILAAVFALVLSFIPTAQLTVGNPVSYVAIIAIGTVGFFIIPQIIANRKKAKPK